MSLRLSLLAPVALATVSLLAGCGSKDDPAPGNTSGTQAAGTTAASGTGGVGMAGIAGATAGTAGVSGGTTAGTGGVSGGTTAGATGGVSAGATAGTGAAGAGSDVAPTFETLQFVITQASCFGAGCHNDDMNPLDLRVDDQLYARITSRISVNCGNIPVVNPGNPQQSAVVKILKGPCGITPRMPMGCNNDGDALCVPPDYIAAIEQWIAMGAPQQ